MPFFQGAHNFVIHGATMNDNAVQNNNTVHNTFVPSTDAGKDARPLRSDSMVEKQVSDQERKRLTGFFSLIHQIYTLFLLRLPNLYLSRVERLSGQATLAGGSLLVMAQTYPSTSGKDFLNRLSELETNIREPNDTYKLPVSYLNLGIKWRGFVDSLLQEWQTLNIISALLVPGILTIFQINGATNDPVTRYLAFWSLISALMSLLYGCLFIIQFSQMKKTTIGIEWMTEALEQYDVKQFWALDVMLALPAIWLAWSILAFIVCIMTFLWRAGPVPPESFNSPTSMVLGFRIFVSSVLGVGFAYTASVFYTFRRYGVNLDVVIAKRLEDAMSGKNQDNIKQ